MKTGKTLQQLAAEIERQNDVKRDFIVDTRHMQMVPVDGFDDANRTVEMEVGDQLAFGINNVGHRQVGEHVAIPGRYYDHMLANARELLCTNVNHWLKATPAQRMVRTLDGTLRAFLSDKYRPLENYDLGMAVLPVLQELGIQVLSCEITETRLYIKGVDERINRDVPTGKNRMGDGSHVIFDTVLPAIVISNSEVGMGALSVETAVWTRGCTNLAVFSQHSMRKYHVGGKNLLLGDALRELMSDKTKRVTDAATWMQVGDIVRGAFDQARFDANLKPMAEMVEQKIEGDPVKVVELASRRFNLIEAEGKSVLRHLIEGGDLTRYGLFNAITRTAEDLQSYDRATELERAGGQFIALPANDWKAIAAAA